MNKWKSFREAAMCMKFYIFVYIKYCSRRTNIDDSLLNKAFNY